LTDEERKHLLPSGKQSTFANRVHWAKTYLSQAKLLEPTKRAHFKISERGRQALANGLFRLDNTYLSQFPEFIAFRARTREPGSSEAAPEITTTVLPSETSQTPDEVLRTTIKQLELSLRQELLDRILVAPPAFFENVIVRLLLAMGYGGSREEAGQIVGRSGDGGIDGVIDQDALGLERVYVQAKRYSSDNAVGAPEIMGFCGSLGPKKANKGVFVTTSYFTQPAKGFAESHPYRIVLIDGEQLAALMIRHNVGVRVDETFHLKKVDEDFFVEE
jgi:restriction system protein